MLQRKDRIHFPDVESAKLWDNVGSESVYRESVDSLCDKLDFLHPHICSPILQSPNRVEELTRGESYFETRERLGLITPAKTPSDILRRGPCYDSESSDEDSSHNVIDKVPLFNACSGEASTHDDRLRDKLEYHRERQRAIGKAIEEYTEKMTKILNWHRDQEELCKNVLRCVSGG